MGENDFPLDAIMNAAIWPTLGSMDAHKKILKAGEDRDLSGNDGQYIVNEDFRICFLLSSSNDEDYNHTVSMIPRNDEML